MKKRIIQNKYIITFLLSLVISAAGNKSLFAQSCNQVEILYTEPDCYKADQHDGAGGNPSNGGKGCKEIAACAKQLYNYSSSVSGPGWTYNWTVTGPAAVTINPNNTSQTININWPQPGDYTLTLTATDIAGNVFTYCLLVHVKEKPVANFTFTPNNVCAGSTISFTGTTTYSGSFMSTWNFGDPASGNSNFASASGNTTVSHLYNSSGTYTVTLIAYSFTVVNGGPNGDSSVHVRTCCADTIKKQVTIKPGSIHIECISTVCAGDTVKYTAVGCANPTWSTPIGGNILNQSGNTVTIIWGNGNPQGQIMATCPGGCLASVPVPIIPTTPVIVGNTSPCVSSITSYSLPLLPGTTYTWTLTNVTNATNQTALLNAYPDNNTVWINWALAPPGNYQLSITLNNQHKCCSSSGTLNIFPKDKWKVYMDMTVCQGSAANLGISPAAGTFNWTVLPPNGGVVPLTGGPGNTFSPVFNNIGTYTVQVYESANTYCNSGIANPQQVKIKVVATLPAGIITGPTTICTNTPYTYTIPAPPTGYYYTWSITSGAATFQPGNLPTTTGNNVSIVWTSLPGTISVILQRNDQPACPSAPSMLNVTQATVGNVTGLISVCVDGLTGYKLTGGNLPPGEPITWTITPPGLGTIINGQGTDTITVLWHGQPGTGPWGPATISATTACGNAVSLGGIMIYPKFSVSITSSLTDICSPGGVTLTVNGVPPLATISWLPGLQNTASINVSVAQTYTVTVTKGGCSDTKTFTVPDPFAIVPVTCGVGFCNGISTNEILGVNVIKPGSGTFTYEWHSGTCTSPGPILSTVTNTNLSNSYTATAPGNYCVIVKYGTCQRCINFTVKKVCCPDVNHPSITFTRNSCNQYVFTGTTPNPTSAPITWNFGDGTTQPGTSGVPVTHTYAHAGTYCVTFCVGAPSPNPTNCTGNCDVKTVVVPIEASFIYTLGCNGCLNITNTSVVITTNQLYVTYLWNFGDGNTSTAQTPPQHCYANPGTYTVTLTISYNDGQVNCTSVATQTVVYTPLTINASSPVCTGTPSYFSSTPAGFVTYAWAFGDGFTAYTAGTTHIYNSAISYNVTLAVTDALGNTCNANTTVNVKPGIANCTILPAYICPGGLATLSTTNVAGYTYLWEIETSPNVFASAPGVNTNSTYTTNTPGFYHVVVYNSYNCPCTSNKVEVKAVTKPKALIGAAPSTHLCGPSTLMLTSINHLPGYTSDWYANGVYGAPLFSGQMYYIPVVGTTTPYSLVLTNEYGCTDTCIMTVFVNPIPVQPTITSNPPGNLCEGGPIQLTVTNYPSNITWNNGAIGSTITVYTAGIYTATYTDPVTGCSSNKSIKVNARPATGLFPHFCDSIPCRCVRPFTIYAPQPLIVNGAPSGNYSIQWYNPTFSGVTGPVFNNAVTGSYYIVVQDLSTGCIDTSDVYSIKVPPCDTCDCKGSHWGDIILTAGEHPDIRANIVGAPKDSIKLECHKAQKLDCNKTYTINASFFCRDTTCNGKVTYSLQPPSGSPITGNVPLTFTTPGTSGTYILTLYGWCGNKICDSCIIDLILKCDSCNCKGSKWGDITLAQPNSPVPTQPAGKTINNNVVINPLKLSCGKTYDVKCKTSYTVNAAYNCPQPNCPGLVKYILTGPTGTTTGIVPLTFSLTATGTYTLTLYGYCGANKCDSCVIKFKTDCPVDSNCCPYNISVSNPVTTTSILSSPSATIASSTFNISGPPGNLFTEIRAEVVNYTLTSNYNNECLNCKSYPYSWASIYQPGNIGTIQPQITMYGSTVTAFNPSGNGMYQNPREVIWSSSSPFAIPPAINLSFLLPPSSIIDCCDLTAKICVKFTFRDKDCKECEMVVCFSVTIKKQM